MKTNDHTPGPWVTNYMERELWVGSQPNQELIAVMERCGYPHEVQANASLIAAAPELLEALEAVAREAGIQATVASNRNDNFYVKVFSDLQNSVDAAIRKAKGVSRD